MGNSQGNARMRSPNDISDVARGKDGWVELDRDEACRFVSLEAPITDAVEFPYDNKPEHGSFVNVQGLRIHTYFWYPQASQSRTSGAGLRESTSRPDASASPLLPQRHSSCSPTASFSTLGAGQAAPSSSLDRNRGPTKVAHAGFYPPHPSPSVTSVPRHALPTCNGRRAYTADHLGAASGSLPAPEQALLDKATAVCGARGVVLLLHGYCNHSRLAWLSKPLPPGHRRRDPTVVGYPTVSEALSVPAAVASNSSCRSEADEQSFDFSPAATLSTAGSWKNALEGTSEFKPDPPGRVASRSRAASLTAEEPAGGCDRTEGWVETVGDASVSASWHIQYQGSWVEALNRAGFLVAAMDFQGHGLSEGWQGKRGSVNRLDDLALDVIQFITIIRRRCQFLRGVYRHCVHDGKHRSGSREVKEGAERRPDSERQTSSKPRRGMPTSEMEPNGGETKEQSTQESNGGIDNDEENPPIFLLGVSLGGWAAARTIQLLGDPKAVASLFLVCDPNGPLPQFSGILTPHAAASPPHSGASAGPLPFPIEKQLTSSLSAARVSRQRQSSSFASLGALSSVGQTQTSLTTAGVSGCVLLSPMLDLSFVKSATKYNLYRHLMVRLAEWAPNMVVSRPLPNKEYPYLEAHMQRDKYTYKGGSRLRMVREMFEGTDTILHPECLSLISESTCGALLVMHNLLDGVCGVEGSLRLFHGATRIRDKSFLAVNAYVDGTASTQHLNPVEFSTGAPAEVLARFGTGALPAPASTLAGCGSPEVLQPLQETREGVKAAGGSMDLEGQAAAQDPHATPCAVTAEIRCGLAHDLSEGTSESVERKRTPSQHRHQGTEARDSVSGPAVGKEEVGTEEVCDVTSLNAHEGGKSQQQENVERAVPFQATGREFSLVFF
ncbi:PST-A protein, related [Neospora caninum Liverpool]|uniref:PST-A protein, related n=1 Tax=Neospora caninum (strain Liverpool) TaxID=572307 RepID=F0VLU7_NEOCL|nr:PST-A protein, related [Neospora caninum Liverpool]CBZ54225.1 PST-A protein, related [Neospora caninum Liverpool]|eukprot:XP_003884256.1 PST-A protein, related [Neospora caninum Liverpool]